MLRPDQILRLRDQLAAAEYTVDAILAAVGQEAHAALGRNATVPSVRALEGRRDPLATLTRLWPLQRSVPEHDLEAALPGLVTPLLEAGMIEPAGDAYRALIDLRPYATDDDTYWIVSDLTPGLDTVTRPMRPDFVLGVSSASSTLAQLTPRRAVRRALDLGTGCGVQTLHLARHSEQIVATDLNPRALQLAALTLALNEVEADLRLGSLYQPVEGERFDLITTNPPYVLSPPTADAARLTYREGSMPGDRLVEILVRGAGERLAEGGTAVVLANWAQLRGRPWTERLAEWIEPTGCDAHVVQREVLDPYAYAELWLADAGLAGSPDYPQRYDAWLDYFDALGLEAVGMGWIVLHQAGRDDPWLRLEEWPHPVEQPIAPAFEAERAAVELDRRLPDDELLANSWLIADDVVVETVGLPGAPDPQHLVFRQQRGFRRAVEVDTGLAGILGACDGDLALGVLIDAVAGLLSVDRGALRTEVLPRFRELAVDGLVEPTG